MAERLVRGNTVTSSACVSACDTAGAWLQALLVSQTMDAARVAKNLFTFNAFMSCCPWREALEMKEMARSWGVRWGVDIL